MEHPRLAIIEQRIAEIEVRITMQRALMARMGAGNLQRATMEILHDALRQHRAIRWDIRKASS